MEYQVHLLFSKEYLEKTFIVIIFIIINTINIVLIYFWFRIWYRKSVKIRTISSDK